MREKVARQLKESMSAFLGSSQILSVMPLESQNRALDLNDVMLHHSQATFQMLTTDYDLGAREISSCFFMSQERSPMEGLPGLSGQRRCRDVSPTPEYEVTKD